MHTRSPDVRRPPKRYDDSGYDPPPASSSPTKNSTREKIGRLPPKSAPQQHLKSPSPPKRIPRRRRETHRGPVIPFTPNLPSKNPPKDDQARPNTTPDQEATISTSDSDEQEKTIHHLSERSRREDSQHLPHMFSTPTDAGAGPRKRPTERPTQRPTIAVGNTTASRAGADMRGQGLGPNDNGPNNPIYMRNMQLMDRYAGMTDFELQMMDSDEDEPQATVTQELAQEVTEGSPPPSWDDFGSAVKLDVADAVNGLYDAHPDAIMNALRLDDAQKDDLTRLLVERAERQAEEDRMAKLLRDHQREILLKGGTISAEENRDMMNRTIYRSAGEETFITATRGEVRKAKRYLQHIGFDPSILVWYEPLTGDPYDESAFDAMMKAGMEESFHLDENPSGSSTQPMRLSTQARAPLPRSHAESALPRPEDAQDKEKQSRTSSHRWPNTSKLIHAQSSPVAPHTVPSRSFPVASSHHKTQHPVGLVPRPSPYDQRGRSVLRPNDMPTDQMYASRSQLPTPPIEPFGSSATGRQPTRPTPVAQMNSNNHAANPHGGDGTNKRKRSASGDSGDGITLTASEIRNVNRKTKKSGGNQG